jgi:2-oxoglutarate dehydrogenase E1 component
MLEPTPLFGGNADYLDSLYDQYLRNPGSVEPRWREYFERLAPAVASEPSHASIRSAIAERARQAPVVTVAAEGQDGSNVKQGAVSRLIQIWVNRGHLVANLDPLGLLLRERPKVLDLAYFGLGDADLDTEFFTGSRTDAIPRYMRLRDIVALFESIYGGTIGAEFAHVSNSDERLWLQDQFQSGRVHYKFSRDERRSILWQLTAAEGLERYLHTKYVGQKRFSLEGGDSLIPLMDDLIQHCGGVGVEDVVIGMAHRGRLNVLVNILGKSPSELFSEFEGKADPALTKGSGDVKYHQGFSADLRTPSGNVHVVLAFNPRTSKS